MGGGLMQLVAYGAQDIYLTGNPQITFFKVVYRRHTNFSMETIEQTLNGNATNGSTSSCTISRNGDLVYRMYITSTTATKTGGSTNLFKEVELEIGGQRIDRHYSEWMNVWTELSTPESKAVGLKSMQGDVGITGSTGVGLVQVPLQFRFCRNPGLALPLIALQYHEVKVKVTWNTNADTTCGINCDYIYLDTDERRRFAQVSHEYLIEQLQKEEKTEENNHKLNFNHPVKELIWTTAAGDDYTSANLKLNGHDRFSLQESEYFQLRQPYECHTAVPHQNLPSAGQLVSVNRDEFKVQMNTTRFTGAVLTVHADPAGAAARIDASANTTLLVLSGIGDYNGTAADALIEAKSDFSAGDTLILQPVTATGAANGIVGRQYYANVTRDLVVADIADGGTKTTVSMPISLPTTNDSSTVDTIDTFTATDTYLLLKATSVSAGQARTSQMTRNINVYSFGLKPEEHQPSGTCNFSRIDNAQLVFTTKKACTVYAVNYNVLRIMSGMGGLAYSN